jgi:hypothetical protein
LPFADGVPLSFGRLEMKTWSIVLALTGVIALGCAATRETVVNAPPERAADVDAIKGVISGFYDAQNGFDVDGFMVLLAEDAKIDSISQGGKIAKAAYGPAMATFWSKPENRAYTTRSRILSITVPDDTHATVLTEFILMKGGSSRPPREDEWKLEKQDGKWLIVDETMTKKRF